MLTDQGFTVYKAPGGRHALAAIERYRVDIAIIDLDMPHLDGIDTIDQMHSLDSHIRYIVLSARDDDDYRRRAAEKGLVIERWLVQQERPPGSAGEAVEV